MKTFLSSEPLSVQSVHVHFDRGFAQRPQTFYDRLNLREWLDTLDWLFAESSDRLTELKERDCSAVEIARERDIQRMLEAEIEEADQAYCRLALSRK